MSRWMPQGKRMVACLLVGWACWPLAGHGAEAHRNLAPDAVIAESGRYSDQYRGQFTANGRISEAGSKADTGNAWCVPQAQAAGATLTYTWPEPQLHGTNVSVAAKLQAIAAGLGRSA